MIKCGVWHTTNKRRNKPNIIDLTYESRGNNKKRKSNTDDVEAGDDAIEENMPIEEENVEATTEELNDDDEECIDECYDDADKAHVEGDTGDNSECYNNADVPKSTRKTKSKKEKEDETEPATASKSIRKTRLKKIEETEDAVPSKNEKEIEKQEVSATIVAPSQRKFQETLYNILNSNQHKEIMYFNEKDNVIVIENIENLEKEVLLPHFHHSEHKKFQKSLRNYS